MGLLDRVRGTAEVAPELDPAGGTSTVGAAGGGKAKAHVPHLDDEVADAAKVASLSLFSDREIKHLWKLFNQLAADATAAKERATFPGDKQKHEKREKALSAQRDEAQGRDECIVCMDNPRAVFFLPCNHCVVCAACAAALQE